MKVAIIGGGVVGSSWALVFARAGNDVIIFDKTPAAAEQARDFVACNDADAAKNLTLVGDLAEAIERVAYIQENAPERLEIKQALYTQST